MTYLPPPQFIAEWGAGPAAETFFAWLFQLLFKTQFEPRFDFRFSNLYTEDTMYPDLALRLMSRLFSTGLLICLPVLALTMAVGLFISIVQVVTQVQEISLTFIPKLVAAALAMAVFGPWMLRQLSQFAIQLWTGIPAMF